MDGKAHIKRAYEAILSQDFELAIAAFEQAIHHEPNNADYHYKLSVTLARSNRLAQALQHAMAACDLARGHKEYLLHWQHLRAKELTIKAKQLIVPQEVNFMYAISLLKKATKLDPLLTEAWLYMGIAYGRLKEYEKAWLAMQDVLRLDPQHTVALELAMAYDNKLNK